MRERQASKLSHTLFAASVARKFTATTGHGRCALLNHCAIGLASSSSPGLALTCLRFECLRLLLLFSFSSLSTSSLLVSPSTPCLSPPPASTKIRQPIVLIRESGWLAGRPADKQELIPPAFICHLLPYWLGSTCSSG